MKIKFKIFLVLLFASSLQVFGQAQSCDVVYSTVDNNPTYEGGMNALMDYSSKYITPIISKYHKSDDELTGKVIIMLTIDMNGNVVDVELSKHNLPKGCVDEIIKQVLTMRDWAPGTVNRRKVCSKFSWIITCIKWG